MFFFSSLRVRVNWKTFDCKPPELDNGHKPTQSKQKPNKHKFSIFQLLNANAYCMDVFRQSELCSSLKNEGHCVTTAVLKIN